MNNRAPIEIPEAKAKELLRVHASEPRRHVVMSIGGKWFDVRHLNEAELLAFLGGLSGKVRH